VFYPVRESDARAEGPLNFALPYFGFGIGWIAYAVKGYTPRAVSLFNPFQPFFAKHVLQCSVSLALFYSWIAFALVPYARAFGLARLIVHYLVPVFGFSTWIVLITFMHHHEEKVPW
jgi:fatty acid desaturase